MTGTRWKGEMDGYVYLRGATFESDNLPHFGDGTFAVKGASYLLPEL